MCEKNRACCVCVSTSLELCQCRCVCVFIFLALSSYPLHLLRFTQRLNWREWNKESKLNKWYQCQCRLKCRRSITDCYKGISNELYFQCELWNYECTFLLFRSEIVWFGRGSSSFFLITHTHTYTKRENLTHTHTKLHDKCMQGKVAFIFALFRTFVVFESNNSMESEKIACESSSYTRWRLRTLWLLHFVCVCFHPFSFENRKCHSLPTNAHQTFLSTSHTHSIRLIQFLSYYLWMCGWCWFAHA